MYNDLLTYKARAHIIIIFKLRTFYEYLDNAKRFIASCFPVSRVSVCWKALTTPSHDDTYLLKVHIN